MTKDQEILRQVSDYFNEDTFKNIIAKEKNVDLNSIEVLSWEFEELSGKGDNYLSVINRVCIKSKVNHEPLDTRLIVKSLPKNIFTRKLLRSAEYFQNEFIFYMKIATNFQKYLADKGQSQLLNIPCCLSFHIDGENDFIALQDVGCLGYNPIPRQNCLTYEECKSIIEVIARFHAISFAYKNEKKEEFDAMSSLLSETFYRNDIYETSLKYFYDDFFRIAKDALAKEYPGSEGERVFNSHELSELFRKTVDICKKKDSQTSVINQGDAWAPNFLIRKSTSGNIDILMLDFQMARSASPALDLVFFIYECTDRLVRDKYYDELLKNYYDELAKTMGILGCDANKQYPWKIFQNDIKEQSLYGLMFALLNIPLTLLPKNKVIDLESITENSIGDLVKLSNLENSEDRQRLADVILHAVEKGFL